MTDKSKDNKQNVGRPPLPEKPKASTYHETFSLKIAKNEKKQKEQ